MPDASTTSEVLDPCRLIAEAEAAVGSADWGEPRFRDALQILCGMAADHGLAVRRALVLKDRIAMRLAQRLEMIRDRRAYPEIAQQVIKAPLIVTGMARAGTTVIHAILSKDPRALSPMNWEVAAPSPPPRADYQDDPRFLAAKERMAKIDPELLAMHTMGADLPEEDNMLFEWAFRSQNLCVPGHIPAYMRWVQDEADMGPAYEFHRQALQQFQAFAPRDFWTLKSPLHMHWLDKLFATYPDARLVVMHRDPAQIVPSLASLTHWGRLRNGPADPRDAGWEVMDEYAKGGDKLVAFRAAHRELADRFIDIRHVDFVRAPMATIEKIYDKFGIDLPEEARTPMAAFIADNQTGRHGGHTYTIDEFGLTKAQVRERFKLYIEAYDVPLAG